MKNLKLYILCGIATLMLTACPKDPVVEPKPDDQKKEEVDPVNPSEGTGIDDLHGSKTDKPAYRKQK
jgi:hypothetical protein